MRRERTSRQVKEYFKHIIQAQEEEQANEPGTERPASYGKHHKNVTTLTPRENNVTGRNYSFEFRHYWEIREDEIYFNGLMSMEAL